MSNALLENQSLENPPFDIPVPFGAGHSPSAGVPLVTAESSTPMPSPDAPSICLHVEFRRLGIRRKVDPTFMKVDESMFEIGVEGEDGQTLVITDKNSLSTHKRILDSPELKKIASHDVKTDQFVKRHSHASKIFKKGVRRVPVALIHGVLQTLNDRKNERGSLVEDFVQMYAQRVAESKQRLGVLHNEADYKLPGHVAQAFSLSWQALSFEPSESLKAISEDMWKAEKAKIDRMRAAELQAGREALLQEMIALCTRLYKSLTENNKIGRKLGVKADLMGEISEFLSLVEGLNETHDKEIDAVASKLRQLVSGVDLSVIRSADSVRALVGAAVNSIGKLAKRRMDDMITDAPARKIVF